MRRRRAASLAAAALLALPVRKLQLGRLGGCLGGHHEQLEGRARERTTAGGRREGDRARNLLLCFN